MSANDRARRAGDTRLRRAVYAMVDVCTGHPFLVIALVLAALGGAWAYARQLELRSDFRELLPSNSPAYQAYEHQRGRLSGEASLIVVVESPDRGGNERFIDALAAKLPPLSAGPAPLVARVEGDVKEIRRFFSRNRWLYASEKDLREAEEELDLQFAVHTGFVEDLGADEPGAAGAPQPKRKLVDVLRDYKRRAATGADPSADYPTGYFETADGGSAGLRIVSTSSGTGDAAGDRLLAEVERIVAELDPRRFHPQMVVGFGGDIPNAIEEKRSLQSDALWATLGAMILILGGIAIFFRSAASIPIVALPAALGVGCAYSFATATFGYVNSSGAFLGAIIIGNGINYPIVLLARYRDFVQRGMAPEVAHREAVVNAFRAELVGALVAAIAYGSLTVTRFRGFSQFGAIGFVGMLLVWISTLPLVPAFVAALERIGVRVVPAPGSAPRGWRWSPVESLAVATDRRRWAVVAAAAAVTVLALLALPRYLKDPWEYDFSKLGSKETGQSGAGRWSNRADAIFGGRTNVASAAMLADTPQQVPLLKARILANDAADPQGRLIAEVLTLDDVLPGSREEQRAKIARIEHIRRRLARLRNLSAEERALVEELTPPEDLHPIDPADLPPTILARFTEKSGRVGTVFYVKYDNNVSLSDGRNLLRIAKSTDRVELPDGTRVLTASRSTIFAEMLRSMKRDGPLATAVSFLAVLLVLLVATHSRTGTLAVFGCLSMGVIWMLGAAAWGGVKLNFLNFVALPITFGIGCEYPFNIFDRSRLLGGDVSGALRRSGGAVALCSYTTIIGYGSLLLADNQALKSFGKLAIAGEFGCAVAALIVLPALLHLGAGARGPGRECAEPPDASRG